MAARSRIPVLALMTALSGFLFGACKADDVPGYKVQVLIMLSDSLGSTATVTILEDGADYGSTVKDATVTLQLNGGSPTQVPYVDSFGYHLGGDISGATPKAGDTVTASITIGAKTIVETVAVPAIPKITPPATAQDASKDIVLSWDSLSPPPTEIQVVIANQYTASDSPMGYYENIAGTSTSYTVPAGTLKPGTTGIYVQVSTENTLPLAGADLEPYSWFTISCAGSAKLDTL
jgi:hypothetical protein